MWSHVLETEVRHYSIMLIGGESRKCNKLKKQLFIRNTAKVICLPRIYSLELSQYIFNITITFSIEFFYLFGFLCENRFDILRGNITIKSVLERYTIINISVCT